MTTITEGSEWLHFRTKNSYVVQSTAIFEETMETLVLYSSKKQGETQWARPAKQWLERLETTTDHTTTLHPRFISLCPRSAVVGEFDKTRAYEWIADYCPRSFELVAEFLPNGEIVFSCRSDMLQQTITLLLDSGVKLKMNSLPLPT